MVNYMDNIDAQLMSALDHYAAFAVQQASGLNGAWYAVRFGYVANTPNTTNYAVDFVYGRRQVKSHVMQFECDRIERLRVYLDISDEMIARLSHAPARLASDYELTEIRAYVTDTRAVHIDFEVGMGGAFLIHHQKVHPFGVSAVKVGEVALPSNIHSGA